MFGRQGGMQPTSSMSSNKSWQNIDEETMRALWNVQNQLNKLEEERDKAMEEIERQFLENSRPLYEERQRICSLVDRFWFHVLCSHPETGTRMTEQDRQILQHLEDIFFTEVEEDGAQGYQINLVSLVFLRIVKTG